jgi:hypothetical protein
LRATPNAIHAAWADDESDPCPPSMAGNVGFRAVIPNVGDLKWVAYGPFQKVSDSTGGVSRYAFTLAQATDPSGNTWLAEGTIAVRCIGVSLPTVEVWAAFAVQYTFHGSVWRPNPYIVCNSYPWDDSSPGKDPVGPNEDGDNCTYTNGYQEVTNTGYDPLQDWSNWQGSGGTFDEYISGQIDTALGNADPTTGEFSFFWPDPSGGGGGVEFACKVTDTDDWLCEPAQNQS